MAPLISFGGMKRSSSRLGRSVGPDEAEAVAMQVEAAGDEVVAGSAVLARQIGATFFARGPGCFVRGCGGE